MSKKVILTGIRANNDLHIGNYFGALLPIIDMAKKHAGEYQVNLFVPDLHSFTTPIDHSKLQEQIKHNLKLFVAAGLPINNENVHFYRQSYVPAHSELTWILSCFTGFGEMSRMTQFKEKAIKLANTELQKEGAVGVEEEEPGLASQRIIDRGVTVGLFNYPILMASDILLYNAEYVPVGDDQTQHLEITRDLAQRMNTKFGEDMFTVPHEVKKQHEFFGNDQGLRIKDLADPTKKMSKSEDSEKGIIFLSDDPSAASTKIKSATTDSLGEINLDYENQPGIANLLQMLACFRGQALETVADEYEGQSQYGQLKQDVADEVSDFLTKFQQAYDQVDEAALQAKLESSEKAMNEIANSTLARVQKAVGLR